MSLDKLVLQVRSHIVGFGVYVRFQEDSMNGHTCDQKEKAWNAGWDAVKNQMPPVRKALEDESGLVLGGSKAP